MLFLFNKVYLKVDHLFRSERERIYISDRLTPDIATDVLRVRVDGTTPVAPLFHASSYDQLIQQNFSGNENGLFSYLYNFPEHRRLTVYCNMDAFVKIATKFWKTLFPRMSAETYWMLLDDTLSHIIDTLATHRSTQSFLSNQQLYDLRSEITDVFDRKDELKGSWASVQPYTITRTQREHLLRTCGVELQLPTTLINSSWRYAHALRAKFVRMAHKRFVFDLTTDLKHLTLLNLERLIDIDPKYQFNVLTDDIHSFVQQNGELKFLTDDLFTPDNIDHVLTSYNLQQLAALHDALNSQKSQREEWVFDILSEPITFDRLLSLHVQDTYGAMLGYGEEYREKINPRTIDRIVAAYSSNDTAFLKQMELT